MRLEQERWVCFLHDTKEEEKKNEVFILEEAVKLGDCLERKGGNTAWRHCSHRAEAWVKYTEKTMVKI